MRRISQIIIEYKRATAKKLYFDGSKGLISDQSGSICSQIALHFNTGSFGGFIE